MDRETHRNHARGGIHVLFRGRIRRKDPRGLGFRFAVDVAGRREREFFFRSFLRKRSVCLSMGFRRRFGDQSFRPQARLPVFGRISGNARRDRFRMKPRHRAPRRFHFGESRPRRRRNSQCGRFLSVSLRSGFEQGMSAGHRVRFEFGFGNLLNLRSLAQSGRHRREMPVFLCRPQRRGVWKGFLRFLSVRVRRGFPFGCPKMRFALPGDTLPRQDERFLKVSDIRTPLVGFGAVSSICAKRPFGVR